MITQPTLLTDSQITDRICELQKKRDNATGETVVRNYITKMAQAEIDSLLWFIERRKLNGKG